MLEVFEKFYAMIIAESMQADCFAVAIFLLWIGVGSLIHELGHLAASRLCGIRGGTLVFRPVNGRRGPPFPGLELDEMQYFLSHVLFGALSSPVVLWPTF